MTASLSSTTIDFSWVTVNAGLPSRTAAPARASLRRVVSLSRWPFRRAAFRIARAFTPGFVAAITARRSRASEKTNILMRSVCVASPIALTIGSAESSGRTMRDRDTLLPHPEVGQLPPVGDFFVQPGDESIGDIGIESTGPERVAPLAIGQLRQQL